jgi:hypothetical protein
MYTLDELNSLTRRGRKVSSLSVVVIAGPEMNQGEKKKAKSQANVPGQSKTELPTKGDTTLGINATLPEHCIMKVSTKGDARLCCMQAHLQVPKTLGEPFRIQVDRCVKFPENRTDDNYQQAVAIYLSTMKEGLEHAIAIRVIQNPRSLCCQEPPNHFHLLASPIPFARQTSAFSIHQGELYRVTAYVSFIDWIRSAQGEGYCLNGHDLGMKDCLVKISCVTVHNTLIPLSNSWNALKSLANAKERRAVCNVLLACGFIRERCLVTVMKDLSSDELNFLPLSLQNFRERTRVWSAFSELVRNVLLPLANLGIVHHDLRCVPDGSSGFRIFNILGKSHKNGTIELRLIDYDSLALFTGDPSLPLQPHAVSSPVFVGLCESPYVFLFWQVLWMAYVLWHPRQGRKKPPGVKFFDFFKSLSKHEQGFEDFKNFLHGGQLDELLGKVDCEAVDDVNRGASDVVLRALDLCAAAMSDHKKQEPASVQQSAGHHKRKRARPDAGTEANLMVGEPEVTKKQRATC